MKSTGTTATVLFSTESALVLANVGDSRAILSNGTSTPIQLSIDHVASNEVEKNRIKSLGGFVSSVGGTQRVNGTLAVSRSLGDAHLASLLSRKPHVVAMSKKEIQEHCQGTPYCSMVIACEFIGGSNYLCASICMFASIFIVSYPSIATYPFLICSGWTLGCYE